MQDWVTHTGVKASAAVSVADAIVAAGFEDPADLKELTDKEDQNDLIDALKEKGVVVGDRTKIKRAISRAAGRGRSPSPAAPPASELRIRAPAVRVVHGVDDDPNRKGGHYEEEKYCGLISFLLCWFLTPFVFFYPCDTRQIWVSDR
jgi:hypothetical protein